MRHACRCDSVCIVNTVLNRVHRSPVEEVSQALCDWNLILGSVPEGLGDFCYARIYPCHTLLGFPKKLASWYFAAVIFKLFTFLVFTVVSLQGLKTVVLKHALFHFCCYCVWHALLEKRLVKKPDKADNSYKGETSYPAACSGTSVSSSYSRWFTFWPRLKFLLDKLQFLAPSFFFFSPGGNYIS